MLKMEEARRVEEEFVERRKRGKAKVVRRDLSERVEPRWYMYNPGRALDPRCHSIIDRPDRSEGLADESKAGRGGGGVLRSPLSIAVAPYSSCYTPPVAAE